MPIQVDEDSQYFLSKRRKKVGGWVQVPQPRVIIETDRNKRP